jgi:sensor histidine kinase YesM
VRDNGPGIAEHRNADTLFRRGLGLANTETRLERLYGQAHSFDLDNAPDGGLVVTLVIPLETNGSGRSNADQ